jgi:hypothetical protein
VRRPVLFPGAAYPVSDRVTGLRGRVEETPGVPARWPRVAAYRPGGFSREAPLGRAHGDDRGEFLLLLGPAPAPATDLALRLEVDLVVFPAPPVPPPPLEQRKRDGLWDLPVEDLSAAGGPDPVAAGAFPPAGWEPALPPVRTELAYGRLLSGRSPLIL